jgi:glutathione synthase/RimK-type ligase-like ATP-grasp enzyme
MSVIKTIFKQSTVASATPVLYLPSSWTRKWKMKVNAVIMRFGQAREVVAVKGMPGLKQPVLSYSLLQHLHIPMGIPVLLSYKAATNTLTVGPLIGILVSPPFTTASAPFGKLTPFLNEVSLFCRSRGGIVCVFQPGDVDVSNRIVRGLIRRGGIWTPHILPLPQCVYNRLPTRREEAKAEVDTLIRQLKNMDIPVFNERFLDKWEVHRALYSHPDTRGLLPHTELYVDPSQLKRMLEIYRTVYAKPTSGSMGKGIYRLGRSEKGYLFSYPTMTGSVTRTYQTLKALTSALEQRIVGKSYVLQQAIPVIRYARRPVDFRILTQKNVKGEWDVTSIVARVGQNQVVSNVARGGRMMSAEKALRLCGQGISIRPTSASLRRTALTISRSLDAMISGLYAELGIDLAVDVHGRIWLLEVNSKPSKIDPPQEGEQTIKRTARPSVRQLWEYVRYLCGFSKQQNVPASRKSKRMGRG